MVFQIIVFFQQFDLKTQISNMKILTGNLIELAQQGRFDVIIHGANCFNTMRAGIAKQIASAFREAYLVDLKTLCGDVRKLGNFSSAKVKLKDKNLLIVNAYTQYRYGRDRRHVDYDAVRSVFHALGKQFRKWQDETTHRIQIGYPMIGAGLAGGDFNIIAKIIDEELEYLDHYVVKLPKKAK